LGNLLEKARQAVRYIRASWGEEVFPNEDTSAENEMSVVQYANLCQHKILLTGDTGREGLLEVINYAPLIGLNLPGINRFQVPHHGGRRNVTSELLDALLGPRLQNRPQKGHFAAVISSAKEDEDHPRKVVVRALIHRGANVSTTEGRNVRLSQNAPDRWGYVTLIPEPYPEEYEE
jgi:beta-lactamase superfamily II metal-dependent hydrolase